MSIKLIAMAQSLSLMEHIDQNEKLRNACVMYLDAQDWLAKVSCDKELMKTLKEIKGE